MMVAFMQNLGVMNQISVPWPDGLVHLFELSSLFLLNLQSMGLNCAANGDLQQYLGCVIFFWTIPIMLPLFFRVSQVRILKQRGLSWEWQKTVGLVGSFLQSLFTAMSNIAMVPFMCYSHPSGDSSLLKYRNVVCGSSEHSIMQLAGGTVLMLCLSHFILCCWVACQAPSWSRNAPRRLIGIHFLMANFKPSNWWFGLVPLVRGPLLSVPSVATTDLPGINLTLMLCVMIVSSAFYLWFQPWKAPLLNLVDAISTSLFLVLLAISIYLEPAEPESLGIVEFLGFSAYYTSIAVIAIVFFLAFALMVLKRCKKLRGEPRIVNLGTLPEPEEMLSKILEISSTLESQEADRRELLLKKMALMSSHDLFSVQMALNILCSDCELGEVTSGGRSVAKRISMMTRKSVEQLRQVESAPSDKAASGDECQLESSSDASATFGDIPKEHSEGSSISV